MYMDKVEAVLVQHAIAFSCQMLCCIIRKGTLQFGGFFGELLLVQHWRVVVSETAPVAIPAALPPAHTLLARTLIVRLLRHFQLHAFRVL
jgi:hypothetical protein